MPDYKILLVEDDDTTAFIQTVSLKKLGFSVEVVKDGNRALSAIRASRPDMVVLDLVLPGTTGTAILAKLLDDPELNTLSVIANTANMEADNEMGKAFADLYRRRRGEEPLMVNKIPLPGQPRLELPYALAQSLLRARRPLPPALADWLSERQISL